MANDFISGARNVVNNTISSVTDWYGNLDESTQNRLAGTGITLASIGSITYTGARTKKGDQSISIKDARNIVTALQFTGLGIAQIVTGKPIFGDRRILDLFTPIETQVVFSLQIEIKKQK